jgi:hypothetical protein
MKKFIITYMATGGVIIEAEDEEKAKEIFNNMDSKDLLDDLEENGIEMTDCFEEEE